MTDESKKVFLVQPYSPTLITEAVNRVRQGNLAPTFSVNLDIDGVIKRLLKLINADSKANNGSCYNLHGVV